MRGLEDLRDSISVVRSAPTLREQALEKLRRAIVEGKLSPGARLVERKLCDALQVSRTVVREILRQLEAEGWVTHQAYKGPAVATMSLDDARQIYEMRAALEGLAARLCVERATDAQIKRLEAAVDAMDAARQAEDVERQIKTIEHFYEVLLEGANNTMMSAFLASQRSRLARLRSMSLSQPQRASVSVQEKRNMVAAIRARQPEEAQRLAEYHVYASAKAAFAQLPEPAAATSRKAAAAPGAKRGTAKDEPAASKATGAKSATGKSAAGKSSAGKSATAKPSASKAAASKSAGSKAPRAAKSPRLSKASA